MSKTSTKPEADADIDEDVGVRKPDFSERLKPGPAVDPNASWQKMQGTGQAIGVVFSNGRKSVRGVTLIEGKGREAMRYLKAQTDEWRAMNPEMRGRSRPDLWQMRTLPHNEAVSAEIEKYAEDKGVSIEWTFLTTKEVLNAPQPQYRNNFWIVPSGAEGIWCVFYES